ncbi:His-Xaa-Ser repeat protein HxsA2 [Methylobacillus glycogenes]|uniref:His-Xaa-Ser repeat protein HxsA2 n=1 Tax=Methylobacillus glycogenes TaxID=406 RepID=UPI0011DE3314
MIKSKKYLLPFAAVASAFVTDNVSATPISTPTQDSDKILDISNHQLSNEVTVGHENLFTFILERNEAGILMAAHRSHSSHSSHSSHRSHYSSR